MKPTVINVADQRKKSDRRENQLTSGAVIKISGSNAIDINGNYRANSGNKLSIKLDILNNEVKRVDLTGLVLTTKLVKRLNDTIVDEMYLTVDIELGEITLTGTFSNSGKWILSFDEVNESLKQISSDWKLTGDDIIFLV